MAKVRRLLAGGLSLVVFGAIIFELSVRVEDYLRYGVPLTSPFRSTTELVVRDRDGMHGRANASFEKWRLNNVGTRGPDVERERSPDTFRIVVVGASESFGLYESPDHEYPRVLEMRLNSLRSARGCTGRKSFEVLNAALPGMTLPTIAQDVRMRLARLRPDVVLVYPTPVQYLDDRLPVAAVLDSAGDAGVVGPYAFLRPRGVGRLRAALKSVAPELALDILRGAAVRSTRSHAGATRLLDQLPMERLARFESDLEMVVQEILSIGSEPVVVAHVNAFPANLPRDHRLLRAWERFYPMALGDVIVDFDSAARPVSAHVAAKTSAWFVDASRAFEFQTSQAFSDYAHFTDRGAAIIADTLAVELFRPGAAGDRVCRNQQHAEPLTVRR